MESKFVIIEKHDKLIEVESGSKRFYFNKNEDWRGEQTLQEGDEVKIKYENIKNIENLKHSLIINIDYIRLVK